MEHGGYSASTPDRKLNWKSSLWVGKSMPYMDITMVYDCTNHGIAFYLQTLLVYPQKQHKFPVCDGLATKMAGSPTTNLIQHHLQTSAPMVTATEAKWLRMKPFPLGEERRLRRNYPTDSAAKSPRTARWCCELSQVFSQVGHADQLNYWFATFWCVFLVWSVKRRGRGFSPMVILP